ncbi:MAG: hypothetical protein MZV49_11070 [Rhodopseudomonas palustris]|nr:hypothetical protein [Rhodopseudomonas palustris]
MLLMFVIGFYLNAAKRLEQHRWYLWLALLMIPAPIASPAWSTPNSDGSSGRSAKRC